MSNSSKETQNPPCISQIEIKKNKEKGSTMATKMNSNTHKMIIATYTNEYLYAVPIDWKVNDIKIKDGTLYYKQKEQDVPKEGYEPNYTYPNQIEDYEDGNLEDYFDCEEDEGCVKCCSCDEAEATNKVFRDALGEYEHTCDKCFKKEYEEEQEEERYCENEKCPYDGYCFGELKEQFEGKPYICEGCVNGKGLQEQEEEEVRCVCPKCFAEGHTFVSKERAKELEKMEEMEEMCPFGEKCNGEEEE